MGKLFRNVRRSYDVIVLRAVTGDIHFVHQVCTVLQLIGLAVTFVSATFSSLIQF